MAIPLKLSVGRPIGLLILSLLLNACGVYAYDTLCANGNTAFEASFPTGVRVYVGPPTIGRLATRVCRAVLSWDDQKLVVANDVAAIDLDLFGADLEPNEPVAAFQIKKSSSGCCVTYEIYSLTKPPHLLRSLHGGGYFWAADGHLDGRIEIWSDDSAAVDGLEGLHTSEMEFPPTSVLRFEHGRLLDVSSEFQSYYDQVIAELQKRMSPDQLQQFQQNGGKQEAYGRLQAEETAARQLRLIKTQILEIVWAYLYSHREKEAWKALREMWPSRDVERIRSTIIRARAHGLRAQLDDVSYSLPPLGEAHASIDRNPKTPARPIMVRYYPPSGGGILHKELQLKLVIDCAGKVWSAEIVGKDKGAYEYVKNSTVNWKFIPAFEGDQPVASRFRMTISLKR